MAESLYTVFGGTGYLGGTVVRRLLASGARVRIAARHSPPARAGLDEAEFLATDVRDDASVARAVNGAAGAVNAVALYVEGRHGPSFQDIHVEGARRVARRARDAGAALVQISGIGADPASPSRYVAARGRGEAAVREAHPGAVVLRPSVLFGPGDAFVGTLDAITRLPVIPLFGDGSTRLQPVHVGDVAAAVERALASPQAAGSSFERGGGEAYSYRRILEMVMARRRRRRLLLPLPFPLWMVLARVCSLLPRPPLTVDQVRLMQRDNVAGAGPGLEALGVRPRALAAELADCLDRR